MGFIQLFINETTTNINSTGLLQFSVNDISLKLPSRRMGWLVDSGSFPVGLLPVRCTQRKLVAKESGEDEDLAVYVPT